MGESLGGQAALVTGGGSGIGLACARHLIRDGASVTLMGRSEDRLRSAADTLAPEAAGGAEVRWSAGDTSSEDDVARAVAAASEVTGALQLVVASAGTGTMGPVVATSMSEWERVLSVNLTGTFLAIKHAAPVLARAGGGSIVAISSIAAPLTHPYMAPYSVSKAGIETLVRNAADELGHAGVRVNAVRPGLVPTELADPLVADEQVLDDYLAQMPLAPARHGRRHRGRGALPPRTGVLVGHRPGARDRRRPHLAARTGHRALGPSGLWGGYGFALMDDCAHQR